MRALVFGASGYIGSNLVPALLAQGWPVRAAARRLELLRSRDWPGVDCVRADALDPATLPAALEGVEVAYYLVHSMAAGAAYPALDRQAALNFRDAAARAGVARIVFLGALQPTGATSAHLNSRVETGSLLREGPVPVTEVRAGIVIGPGSAAFEIIRDLVFHLPVMVTPRWVSSRSQPIALEDLLAYLVQLPQLAEASGQVYDAGGPEVLTYADLIRGFARLVGRRPWIVPVPALTLRLSAYGLELVTAVPAAIGRALIEGLAFDLLADDTALRALVPRRLKTYREAVEAVLRAEQTAAPRSRWFEGSMLFRRQRPEFAFYAKHMHAQAHARAGAEALWGEVERIGGEQGFYFLDALWRARGRLDGLAGGVGLRRGRRDPEHLEVGDTVDSWRVVDLEPGRRLTLLSEMRLPGSAAMEFEVSAGVGRRSTIDMTVHFHPAGPAGIAYWNALRPAHAVLFDGMAHAIARRAERTQAATAPAA